MVDNPARGTLVSLFTETSEIPKETVCNSVDLPRMH